MAENSYVLLDTDVYSFLNKPGDTRREIYRPHVEGNVMCVSFITVGEILYGAKKKGWSPARIEDTRQKLLSLVVVPYDYELCARYGTLRASLEEKGITVALHDLWIASCALRHSIPLISNNRKHFEHVIQFGLELISEAPIVAEIQSQTAIEFTNKPSSETGAPSQSASETKGS
jgi:tRNA(fMet)-specific endonuclease VapC